MVFEIRLVETFNTHLMRDDVVRALATGRDTELADIMRAIGQAVAQPDRPPPALITYGERGSGKSFLMRLVQLECAAMPGLACVLLPEEQYNIRTPQKILQVVASQVRGEAWTETAWEFDSRNDEDAWAEDLAALHAALDARFGVGRGLAVVLLENLDLLFLKLFGTSAPSSGKASAAASSRRLAEERLRKLMTQRGGRFMLVASATVDIDIDYERPMFMAFRNIDLQPWDSSTAIRYYNKRRELQGLPALKPAEQARAGAVTEFTGGNARLTQLLGTALSTPAVQDIANIFDELVDKLSDYYRQRLDALPPATAGLLDALIRGGEPVTQSGLAQRAKATQPQIADAFGYLIRSRLVQAGSPLKPGGGQLFKVRDRLFVHFYRRRYGQASALVAIAELLERVLTPEEREAEIRSRLLAGDCRDIAAFGHLRLSPHTRATGYCPFRDSFISRLPKHYAFSLSGVAPDDMPSLRRVLREQPGDAYRYWSACAQHGAQPLQQAAASVLAAIALSRIGQDQLLLARAEVYHQQARHREALRDYQAAAELAGSLNDVPRQAQALNNLALVQLILKDTRAARTTAEQALQLALAIDPPEFAQAGWARMVIAQTLLAEDLTVNAPDAITHLLDGLDNAAECDATNLAVSALEALILVATETPSLNALKTVSEWLVRDPTQRSREDSIGHHLWPLAVAKANAWPEALALAQRAPDWLARTPIESWREAFSHAAMPWMDEAERHGRAAAYAQASTALPAMRELWILRGATQQGDPLAAFSDEWSRLVGTLTSNCRDPDLLRDLTELFDSVLGSVSASQTALLRAFAELHAAPNQEAYLRQADPDLALMMRRVLNLSKPPDALVQRGRKRSR